MTIKYIADENIPLVVVTELKKKGLDIESTSETKRGLTDSEILKLAYEKNKIVITFDKDFGQLVFRNEEKTKGT